MPTPKPVKAKASTPKLESLPALVTELWGRWVCQKEIGVDVGWQDVLYARGYKLNWRECKEHKGSDEWNILSGPEESPEALDS